MTEAEVTGAPSKMAANREDLTPMMTQYLDLCEAYPDSLVLFQVGDFYETFCEAAEETARVLEITLTSREDSSGEYAMSGIPIDDAPSYVETLLERGYRVAIADQVQDPEEATGVVDRAVTRVVTPGTVTEDELLAAGANYVACATRGEGDPNLEFGVAFVDVSTGEFLATGVPDEGALVEELDRYDPAELVVGPDYDPDFEFEGMVTEHDPGAFEEEAARGTLREHVGNPDALLESAVEVRACGGLLAYVEYTQGGDQGDLGHVDRVRRYDPREYLGLDRTALRSLEVFENRAGGDEHTLFGVLDDTASALGRRELTEWLRHPLVREADIEARLDAVEEWTERSLSREEARAALAEVYDLERLLTRVSRGRANARDLRSLKDTLDAVPQVKAALADARSQKLRSLRERLDELADVRGLIGRAIAPDPPQEVTEGDVIRAGFDEDLDRLRETEREGRAWVADLEERERERTGIDSLEVGYNEVHGYYIEVTNPNLDRVPEDYTRRQTLKNSERFYTPDLKEREDEILGAAERADGLEYDLFCEVREGVAAEAERISATADALAELDALATLAAAAVQYDYARPEFGDDGIEIRRGRHPVVERVESDFVPNDTDLTTERQAVITGPNMSGKSTYMRQVALICILAQAGSFVPAAEARLPILDRVFTRVGASDDIAGGQSTFMREMAELTTILHAATADSLVLLDEVGRGTSTADGLAIARAVTEFVHDEVGAYTLFATHYHGLTDLAADLPHLCNLHFGADRRDGAVTFRHEVERGASSSSYGVEVARMAGVPDPVVERAHELLAERGQQGDGGQPAPGATPAPGDSGEVAETDGAGVEANGGGTGSERDAEAGAAAETETEPKTGTRGEGASGNGSASARARETPSGSEAADLPDEVVRRLRGTDLARTTPLEALQELDDLKRLVEAEADD